MDDAILTEQRLYYRERAPEYDDWIERRGRYDRGEKENAAWFAELAAVRTAIERSAPAGRVLELACGTGQWTELLADCTATLTALDASPEMIEANRRRVRDERVAYVQADLFQWQPQAVYDFVFFGFWLSHVPPDRFDAFWALVRQLLAPGGRFFLVDSACKPQSAPRRHRASPRADWIQTRHLADGREFDIVKIFYERQALATRLTELGFEVSVGCTAKQFIYATGRAGEIG